MIKSILYWGLIVPCIFLLSLILPILMVLFISNQIINIVFPVLVISLATALIYIFITRKLGKITKIISIILFSIFLISSITLNITGSILITDYRNSTNDWISDQFHHFDKINKDEKYYFLVCKITGFQDKAEFIELYSNDHSIEPDENNCYHYKQLETSELLLSEVLDLKWRNSEDKHGTRQAVNGKINLEEKQIIVIFSNGEKEYIDITEILKQ